MSRFILFFLCFILFLNANAQLSPVQSYWQMELEKKGEALRIEDSIRYAQDSLQMFWIKAPSLNRPNQFIDSLKRAYTVENGDLLIWIEKFNQNEAVLSLVKVKQYRESWIIIAVGLILLFFSILKLNYSSQLSAMMHAVYSNAALTQINKEENIYNRWPFILLYILFGCIFGMYIFLGTDALHSFASKQTLVFYLLISLGVVLFLSFKIVIVKLLGFIFEVQSLAKEYTSILLLSYFNSAVFVLPLVLIFAFLPRVQIEYLFIYSFILLVLFFSLQFIRIGYYTLKAYKFSKFYLILYFCVIEMGPLIILTKTIGQ